MLTDIFTLLSHVIDADFMLNFLSNTAADKISQKVSIIKLTC